MTAFWLFLGRAFQWSFSFYDIYAYALNWIFFFVAVGFFLYWCYKLVFTLGNNKDKEYESPTGDTMVPYYSEDRYKNPNKK